MYIRKAFHYRGTSGWREWDARLTGVERAADTSDGPEGAMSVPLRPYMYLPSPLYVSPFAPILFLQESKRCL